MIKRIAWILALILFKTSFAQDDSIDKKINALLAAFPENLNIGIMVQEVDHGKVLYSKNADRYFIPASNQKLFTAFAALKYFNPEFKYQTRLFANSHNIQNGVLNDQVYIQFTGDPTLTTTEFKQLFQALKAANITAIQGDILIDDTAFDDMTMSPGSTWDDRNYCFGSPLQTIILDHNCTGLTIAPTKVSHKAGLSIPKDATPSMFFINDVVTKEKDADCHLQIKLMNDTTYKISGCINVGKEAKTLWLATQNPRIQIQQTILDMLKEQQIAFNGTIRFQKINNAPPLLASVASPVIPNLIHVMMKNSDNTIANALFKTLGFFYKGDIGSFDHGSEAVRQILQKTINLDAPATTFIDGAGNSRYNYLTPKQILSLLRNVYYSNISTWFISSLPVAGVDGTLKNRMLEKGLKGKIRAKTGTESGVTSLAGYIYTKDQRTLAFAIMINGFVDAPSKYKALEDKICTALVESY